MKIYFTASILSKSEYLREYKAIVEALRKLNHSVVSEHIFKKDTNQVLSQSEAEQQRYYRAMLARINECELMVAEVSFPSTVHIGHELTLALEKGKPVLALHLAGKRPVLFWGIDSERFYLAEYNLDNLEDVLQDSIEYLSDQQDVRFNFFISPKIQQYLDWVARYKRTPRAVYLRELLEKDMRENKDWKKQK
jgi:hypothetical protein